MPGPVALVYGDELMKHRLSDQHPLQPIRVKLAMDLIARPADRALPPAPSSTRDDQGARARPLHPYVDLVRRLSDPAQRDNVAFEEIEAAGLGRLQQPISDDLHEGDFARGWSNAGGGACNREAARAPCLSAHLVDCITPDGDRASAFAPTTTAIACRWLKDQGHRVA